MSYWSIAKPTFLCWIAVSVLICQVNYLYYLSKWLILTLNRESPATIKLKTSEAKQTLIQWKETYFDTRAKIEASGRDARWEFDRKRLFERTDYMATICEDIYEVAQVRCIASRFCEVYAEHRTKEYFQPFLGGSDFRFLHNAGKFWRACLVS